MTGKASCATTTAKLAATASRLEMRRARMPSALGVADFRFGSN
jgi:hypothetical protein